MIKKTSNKDWTKQDIFVLPAIQRSVLQIFLNKKSYILTFRDIVNGLKVGDKKGKNVGGTMAGFSKYKEKEPLIIKLTKEEWMLKKKYKDLVVEALKELEELRKDARIK